MLKVATFKPEVDWVPVTERAAWQPRDSSGELVFQGKLWLLGGWFDSFAAPPRDVWSSADGKEWQLVTSAAPWRYSDLPMTVVFNERMWLMGGWTNGRLEGHVPPAKFGLAAMVRNGTAKRTGPAGVRAWPRALSPSRAACGSWVALRTNYFGDNQSLKNDVWSSADGVHWQREVEQAPWSPRAYHQALVHDDRLWVMGGGNYVPEYHAKNDVWSSTDGIHWELATESAPWSARLWFSAVTYHDQMWVLGGWSNNPSTNHGDVWHSADGKQWDKLITKHSWKARHEHSSYVFQDQIIVAGGHAQPLSNEVWALRTK